MTNYTVSCASAGGAGQNFTYSADKQIMTSVPLKFCEKVGGQIDPQPPKDGGHSKKLRVIVPLTPAYFHH